MRPRLLDVSPFRFKSGEFDLAVSLIILCDLRLRQRGEETACTIEFCDCEVRITCLNCGLSQPVSGERLAESLWAQSDGGYSFLCQNKREAPLLALLGMDT